MNLEGWIPLIAKSLKIGLKWKMKTRMRRP